MKQLFFSILFDLYRFAAPVIHRWHSASAVRFSFWQLIAIAAVAGLLRAIA
jgi:hypothetical protein